jgi:hypothetical protein
MKGSVRPSARRHLHRLLVDHRPGYGQARTIHKGWFPDPGGGAEVC